MKSVILSLFSLIAITGFVSCNNSSTENSIEQKKDSMNANTDSSSTSIKEEAVSYSSGGTVLKGYIAYDEKKQGKRPVVLVLPEWWGLTDYPRMRAKMLAQMGYIAMAVDIYGDGKIVDNPKDAQAAAMPFYQNPEVGKQRLDAAIAKAKTLPLADSSQVAAIGYCFGGGVLLNSVKMGSDLKAIVSFHGSLQGVSPNKNLVKAQILVCQGGADSIVSKDQVAAFRKSMDSAGVAYTFKEYANATHAFTNPAADSISAKFKMPIKYNPEADKASWNDMKDFFAKILH